MSEKDILDPLEWDRQETKKLVEEEEADEQKAEDELMKDHAIGIEADRIVDSMGAVEASENQRRIVDEVTDKKEEDGGEYRE